MTQAFQDYGKQNGNERPLIGLYECLLCAQCFSTKLELKRHYCDEHEENIPNYEGGNCVPC